MFGAYEKCQGSRSVSRRKNVMSEERVDGCLGSCGQTLAVKARYTHVPLVFAAKVTIPSSFFILGAGGRLEVGGGVR